MTLAVVILEGCARSAGSIWCDGASQSRLLSHFDFLQHLASRVAFAALYCQQLGTVLSDTQFCGLCCLLACMCCAAVPASGNAILRSSSFICMVLSFPSTHPWPALMSQCGCLQDGAGGQQPVPSRAAESIRHCNPHAAGEHSIETRSAAAQQCCGFSSAAASAVLRLQQRCQLPHTSRTMVQDSQQNHLDGCTCTGSNFEVACCTSAQPPATKSTGGLAEASHPEACAGCWCTCSLLICKG